MKTLVTFLISVFILDGCISYRFGEQQVVNIYGSSGFYMKEYVVTCNHVVKQKTLLLIEDVNKKTNLGVVVARDTSNDIAIIKYVSHIVINKDTIQITGDTVGSVVAAELATKITASSKSDSMFMAQFFFKETPSVKYKTAKHYLKQELTVIGHPGDLLWSHVDGHVQSKALRYDSLIQIGTTPYFGLSGAPALDKKDRLVGVFKSIVVGTGFAFLVPIEKVELLITKTDRMFFSEKKTAGRKKREN